MSKRKPTKQEMDKLMSLLAVAEHIIHCNKCAQHEAAIFNHAQIPLEGIPVNADARCTCTCHYTMDVVITCANCPCKNVTKEEWENQK